VRDIYSVIRCHIIEYVGYQKPSKINETAFNEAIDDISRVTMQLLDSLATKAPARNREAETVLARKHAAEQYPQSNQ